MRTPHPTGDRPPRVLSELHLLGVSRDLLQSVTGSPHEPKTWAFTIPDKCQSSSTTTSPSTHLQSVYLTYQRCWRDYKGYSSPVEYLHTHKPFNNLRTLLINPMDKTEKSKQWGVVYTPCHVNSAIPSTLGKQPGL